MNIEDLDKYSIVDGQIIKVDVVTQDELSALKVQAEAEIQRIIAEQDKVNLDYNSRVQYWTDIIVKIDLLK